MAPSLSLSLPAVTLGLGLSANAYFFFGNLAAAQMGIASLISSPEKRKRYALDAGKSSELFDTFYHYAAVSTHHNRLIFYQADDLLY
jgi:hypothetical protein